MNIIYTKTERGINVAIFNGIKYFERDGRYVTEKPRKYLHVAIYEYFVGPVPDGYIIHHIDGDPSNNCILNLKMMTRGEHTTLHWTGRHQTEKSKEKQKASWTPELRAHLRECRLGKKHSKEARRKIREARAKQINPMLGRHHSEETKHKISELAKLRSKNKQVMNNGS